MTRIKIFYFLVRVLHKTQGLDGRTLTAEKSIQLISMKIIKSFV